MLGEGIAGLTAALNLLKKGVDAAILRMPCTTNTELSGANFRCKGINGRSLRETLLDSGRRINDRGALAVFCKNVRRELAALSKITPLTPSPFGLKAENAGEMHSALVEKTRRIPRIGGEALRIASCSDGVAGVEYFDLRRKKIMRIACKAIVLATGGSCGLYSRTTCSPESLGLGYGLALNAGAALRDMEFVMYHPFKGIPTDSLENARVFGDGKRLFEVETFLKQHNAHHGLSRITKEFSSCKRVKIACGGKEFFTKPAAHFTIGGVAFNASTETGVKGLYACGEAAGGMHGADRLGGTALSEALVFGKIAANSASEYSAEKDFADFDLQTTEAEGFKPDCASPKIRILMDSFCFIERKSKELNLGLECLNAFREKYGDEHANATGVKNVLLLDLAEVVFKASLSRRESRGSFFRREYPGERKAFEGSFYFSKSGNNIRSFFKRAR